MPAGQPHTQSAPAAEPLYSPATEKGDAEEEIASRWELLRRNPEFQTVAKKWVASASFRNGHALTPEYLDSWRDVPRCALDWMLTPEQRFGLAKHQITNCTWRLNRRWNFGPVVCRFRDPGAAMPLKTAYEATEVGLLKNAPEPITFSDAWDRASEPFKHQFRFAVHPRKPAFASINKTIEDAAFDLGVIARKLQAGDPLREMEIMAVLAYELADSLNELSVHYQLYRIAHGDYSSKALNGFLEAIKQDFSGPCGKAFSAKKYDTHRSYLGTAQDWHWFLEAESRGLDITKSADITQLARCYSEDLRQRVISRKGPRAPRRTLAHGHTGTAFPYKALKDRRSAVKRHVLAIQEWIRKEYLPLPQPQSKTIS